MPAPTDLEDLGYGRGQLRAGPAASVRRLDVLLGRPLDINSAYRNYDEQMRAYLAYIAYINGRGPWAPLALHPDKSWHCKGLALDSDDAPGYNRGLSRDTWKEYGWLFEVKEELWHGQYYTSMDKHYGEPAGGNAKPLPTPDPSVPLPKDVESMNIIQYGAAIYLAAPGFWHRFTGEEWDYFNRTVVPAIAASRGVSADKAVPTVVCGDQRQRDVLRATFLFNNQEF